MSTHTKRIVISVPEDMRAEIEQLKCANYGNQPYAEVYRQLIRLGLRQLSEASTTEQPGSGRRG